MNWRAFLPPPNGIFAGRALSRGERIQIALLIGVAAGLAAWFSFQLVPEMIARDFTYAWRGGRALLSGQNPYVVIRPIGPPPNEMYFMYPLTTAISALPFALAPAQVGGAIFAGLGAASLAFALSADSGLRRFWVFLSPPFGLAVILGQWSPLLTAAALAAPLSWALTCKPTIGLPLFLYRPTPRSVALCTAFVLLSLVLQPSWPLEWWRATRTVQEHYAPALRPFGSLCLLALIRWRRPEARLVGTMCLVPQNMYFYDQLPLFLAATTGRRTLLLTALSWLAWVGGHYDCATARYCGRESEPWVIALLYLPATAMALVEVDSATGLLAALRRVWRTACATVLPQRDDDSSSTHPPATGAAHVGTSSAAGTREIANAQREDKNPRQ